MNNGIEAQALVLGLQIAAQSGISSLQVEGDSMKSFKFHMKLWL